MEEEEANKRRRALASLCYGSTANNFFPPELNHKFTLKGKLKLLFANEFFRNPRIGKVCVDEERERGKGDFT